MMSWAPAGMLLLLLPLIVAGCIMSPPNEMVQNDPPALGEVSTTIKFGAPVLLETPANDFEPALAVGGDGTIYACAIRGVGEGIDVWRSIDQGKTFESVKLLEPPAGAPIRSVSGDVGGGDCDVGVDSGGRAYVVDLWAGSSSVISSTDQGRTWSGVPFSQITGHMDRPWIVGGERDEVFVTGAQFATTGWEQQGLDAPPPGGIWVSRSTDGGMTFPQQVMVVDNANRLGLNGNIASDGANLYVFYTLKIAEGRLSHMVAVSMDRGKTWIHQTAGEQEFVPRACLYLGIFPVIATDASGGVYLAWSHDNPETGRMDLFFASSSDGGKSWNDPIIVTDRPGTRLYPWIAASPSGEVGIVWYESNVTTRAVEPTDPTGALVCDWDQDLTDAEWNVHFALVNNATSPTPAFAEAVVAPTPAYRGPPNRPYAERIGTTFDNQGRAAVVYTADIDGTPSTLFALQVAEADKTS